MFKYISNERYTPNLSWVIDWQLYSIAQIGKMRSFQLGSQHCVDMLICNNKVQGQRHVKYMKECADSQVVQGCIAYGTNVQSRKALFKEMRRLLQIRVNGECFDTLESQAVCHLGCTPSTSCCKWSRNWMECNSFQGWFMVCTTLDRQTQGRKIKSC